jgi:hypothetical protein
MPTRIKVLIAALITLGLGIFVSLAFIGGGGASCKLPNGIESVFPDCGSAVLGQTEVQVRVAEGYRAELTLNDVPIPLDQVTSGGQIGTNPDGTTGGNLAGAAQTQFNFLPVPGKAVETLLPNNIATVTFYPIVDGLESARSFTWYFDAA